MMKTLLSVFAILGWMQIGVVMGQDPPPVAEDPAVPPVVEQEPLGEEQAEMEVVGFYIAFDPPSCGATCNAAQTRRRLNLYRKVGRAGGFKWVDINSNWEFMGHNEDSLIVADLECEESMIDEVNGISCEPAEDDEDDDANQGRRDLLTEDTAVEEVEARVVQEHLHKLPKHQGERRLGNDCWVLKQSGLHHLDCYCDGCNNRRRRGRRGRRNLRRQAAGSVVPRMSMKQAAALSPEMRLERMQNVAMAMCLEKSIPCIDCDSLQLDLFYQ